MSAEQLEASMRYTLQARLSPSWNIMGRYFVRGMQPPPVLIHLNLRCLTLYCRQKDSKFLPRYVDSHKVLFLMFVTLLATLRLTLAAIVIKLSDETGCGS